MNTNPATAAPDLTADLFDAFRTDDRWAGYGYIGERQNALEADAAEFGPEGAELRIARAARADELALQVANGAGWTAEDLFHWANSKAGRWFADCTIGCGEFDARATRYVARQPAEAL